MTTLIPIEHDRQRAPPRARGRRPPHPARRPARRPRAHRDEGVLPRRASAAPAPSAWTAGSSTPASCWPSRPTAARSTTVEGLAPEGRLSPLQEAFLDKGAVQCGFCIPGQVMAAHDLLARQPAPDGRARSRRAWPATSAAAPATSRSPRRSWRPPRRPDDDGDAASARRPSASAATPASPAPRSTSPTSTCRTSSTPSSSRCRSPGPGSSPSTRARRERVPGVRLRRDGGRPAAARARASAPSSGIARSSRSARRSTTASRSRPWPPTRRTPPTRPRASSGWSTRSCRPSSRSPPPSTRPRPWSRTRPLRPGDPLAGTNVLREHRVGWGDVDAATADLVVDHTYTFPMVTHFAIEPHAFIAAPDGDGIAVWSSIQHPNWLQKIIAQVLGMPALQGPGLRPGSGRRLRRQAAREVRAARRAHGPPGRSPGAPGPDPRGDVPGRPPRGRRGPRPDAASGRTARSPSRTSRPTTSSAPTPTSPTASSARAATSAAGPYRMPAARVVARGILSHTVPSTAFRGFGNPQVNWAVESNLDEGARALGHRPPGDPPAQPGPEGRGVHPLGHAGRRGVGAGGPAGGRADRLGRRPLPAGRGRGIAVGLKSGPTTGLSYSTVRLLADGSVVVYRRHLRHGPGRAHRASPRSPATSSGRRSTGSRSSWATPPSSRTTSRPRRAGRPSSWATPSCAACRDIQGKLRAMAARLHGIDEAAIVVEHGVVRLPDRELPIREVARGPASAGSAARSSATARCARTPSRTTRCRARPRSSSSTARPSRPRSTRRPATSRSSATSPSPTSARPSTRSRSGCRTRARRSRAWATP